MTTTPSPPRTLTALHIARQAWQDARANGDPDRAEVARQRIDTLLERLHTTLPPRQEQP